MIRIGMILLALALTSCAATQEAKPVETPKVVKQDYRETIQLPNMTWYESELGMGSFLQPTGWFVKEEIQGSAEALYITKENIAMLGYFDTGFSVNKVVSQVDISVEGLQSYAKQLAATLASKGKILKQTTETHQEGEVHRIELVAEENGLSKHVAYAVVADTEEMSIYFLAAEAPELSWDEEGKPLQDMMQYFLLGE